MLKLADVHLDEIKIADICSRLNEGDETAFDEVVEIFGDRFRNQVRRMLRHYPRVRRWEETDDVYQTLLIKLHRALQAVPISSASDVFALAATQIRRTLIDLARHYFGKQGMGANHFSDDALKKGEVDAGEEGSPKALADKKPTPGSEPATLLQWSEFHSAVDDLDEQAREVFQLVWYAELPHSQIARLLNISERTVLRRLNQARVSLAPKF